MPYSIIHPLGNTLPLCDDIQSTIDTVLKIVPLSKANSKKLYYKLDKATANSTITVDYALCSLYIKRL